MSPSSLHSGVPPYALALKFISVSCPFPCVLHVELARYASTVGLEHAAVPIPNVSGRMTDEQSFSILVLQ